MLADMSQTERIRFQRNRTLAIWKSTAGNRHEQGAPPSGMDESVRSQRAQGQKTYIRQLASGATAIIAPPCCA
jgi:hypothetical protein